MEIDKIYNLDCYKAIKDIPDKSIDCVYIDVPYLIEDGGTGKNDLANRVGRQKAELMGCKDKYLESKKNGKSNTESLRIAKNCKKTNLDIISINQGFDYGLFLELCRVMKKINIFIWCSKLQILDIMKYFIENKNCLFEIITWHKTNPTPTCNNKWLPDTEYCLYFREKGVKVNDGYELKSKYYISSANVNDKDKFSHPTIKPLELVKRHLLHTTQPNDIVLDCFLGSGTTAVACKEIGRHYIGFEVDKKWFDIAQNRLNKIDANGQLSMFLN